MTTFEGTFLSESVDNFHIFVISGKSAAKAGDVKIQFRSDWSDDGEVPLEINLSFKANNIVLNCHQNASKSGDNKRESKFFFSSKDFKVYVTTCEDKYHIAINDEQLDPYEGLPNNKIKIIKITDDIEEIHQVDHRRSYPYAFPSFQKDGVMGFSSDVPETFRPGDKIQMKAIPHDDFTLVLCDDSCDSCQRHIFEVSAEFDKNDDGVVKVNSASGELRLSPKINLLNVLNLPTNLLLG